MVLPKSLEEMNLKKDFELGIGMRLEDLEQELVDLPKAKYLTWKEAKVECKQELWAELKLE